MTANVLTQLPALNGEDDEFEIHNHFSASFWRHIQTRCNAGENVTVNFTLRHKGCTEKFRAAVIVANVIENGRGDGWWFRTVDQDSELYGAFIDMDLKNFHRGTIRNHPFDMQKPHM